MQISISDQECGAVFAVLESTNWGGSEEALLSRDELYSVLKLERFEPKEGDPKPTIDLTKLARTARKYEVSPAAARHLIAAVAGAGVVRVLGRILAPIVRRTRTLLDAATEKAPGANP